jgi:energy-coupling factor transport system permease protein
MNRLFKQPPNGVMKGLSPDPRAKLLLAGAFAVLLIFTTNVVGLALEFTAVAATVLAARLGRAWLRTWQVLLPMTAFFVVVTLFSFDPVTALATLLRLFALATAFFLFFQSTAPEDLANSLVKMGVPYAFAFILSASLQFVPVLSRRAREIVDAQRPRGIRLEHDFASVPNYPALFSPLLIQSFTMADRLAEAMEARGFGAPHRTFERDYALAPVDYVLILLALALVALALSFR